MNFLGPVFAAQFVPAFDILFGAWKKTCGNASNAAPMDTDDELGEPDKDELVNQPVVVESNCAGQRYALFYPWFAVLQDRLLAFVNSGTFEPPPPGEPTASLIIRTRLTFNFDEATVEKLLVVFASFFSVLSTALLLCGCWMCFYPGENISDDRKGALQTATADENVKPAPLSHVDLTDITSSDPNDLNVTVQDICSRYWNEAKIDLEKRIAKRQTPVVVIRKTKFKTNLKDATKKLQNEKRGKIFAKKLKKLMSNGCRLNRIATCVDSSKVK